LAGDNPLLFVFLGYKACPEGNFPSGTPVRDLNPCLSRGKNYHEDKSAATAKAVAFYFFNHRANRKIPQNLRNFQEEGEGRQTLRDSVYKLYTEEKLLKREVAEKFEEGNNITNNIISLPDLRVKIPKGFI